jgi:hypothetical protein
MQHQLQRIVDGEERRMYKQRKPAMSLASPFITCVSNLASYAKRERYVSSGHTPFSQLHRVNA